MSRLARTVGYDRLPHLDGFCVAERSLVVGSFDQAAARHHNDAVCILKDGAHRALVESPWPVRPAKVISEQEHRWAFPTLWHGEGWRPDILVTHLRYEDQIDFVVFARSLH